MKVAIAIQGVVGHVVQMVDSWALTPPLCRDVFVHMKPTEWHATACSMFQKEILRTFIASAP